MVVTCASPDEVGVRGFRSELVSIGAINVSYARVKMQVATS